MANLTLVQAITLGLQQEMEKDSRVVLLGEDVGLNGGVFRVTEGLQKQFGADRVIDTPLSESGIMGASIGLALAGMRPIPEIQFEGFMGPAYDQLVNHAARYRNRTRGAFNVPLTLRVPVGGGIHAPEFHSDSPEAIYVQNPGLKIVMASTPYDARACSSPPSATRIPSSSSSPSASTGPSARKSPRMSTTVPIGQAKVVSEGTDCTVVSWGAMVFECLKAIDSLPEDQSVELIDLRTIWPIDIDTITASVQKTGRCVIVQEAPKSCSMAAELSALIQENCFLHLQAPVQRVTGFDCIMPYAKIEMEYLPSAERIGAAVGQVLAY